MVIFLRYSCVGVFNTAIHWLVFWLFYSLVAFSQAVANIIAFLVAVSFSFLINGVWTYRTRITWRRYVFYSGFMAFLAAMTGFFADRMDLPALLTLMSFSALSLVCGFLYSKHLIFR